MPRSSNDYSSKQTVSPEVKSISAKRLLRGVQDCARKLDAGRQHRRNLISLFQPEQVKLRHKLREACEKLMFTYPGEYGRKAEELLWKTVYYDVVHAVKSGRKFQSNAPGALQQRHLEPHYKQFLYSAIGFYHYLLLRLQSKVKAGLVEIDFPLASRPLHRNATLLNDGFTSHKNMPDDEEKELEDWVKSTSYRLLVCLGDLSRYQMEFGASKTRPSRYYQLALLAQPNAGMPHNQLAALAGHHSWWGLTAAYHYCRSLHAEISFEGAEGNLQKLFDRNKKLFYQLPTDALDGVISATVYKKEHTRIFIVSFLYLCDLLRPKTYATDVETTGLCKRLIDALHVCLSHMNSDSTDNAAAVEDGLAAASEIPLTNKFQHKPESKRYTARSSAGSIDRSPSSKSSRHHSSQHRLNGDIIFKICVMCLVNVHDLQSCRSNRSSAAIAFILAFFSHLLGYLIQQLTRPASIINGVAGDGKNDGEKHSKADGDNASGSFDKSSCEKSKKPKSRLRRRRRVGGIDDDDLSEGEEDVMGGGDAASDSELSDTDDDDSEILSDSSESENRLSQEDLSSQENVSNSNENDLSLTSKTAALSIEDSHGAIASSPPSLAVASLQDLSNKMFQPSTRRKITLAPSFLQHLTPNPNRQEKSDAVASHPIETSNGEKVEGENDELRNGTGKAIDNKNNETEGPNGEQNSNDTDINNQKQTEEKQQEDANKAFKNFASLSRHHHVMGSVKLLSDWLVMNERVAAACAKNSKALWNRLVCLINLLPTEKEMMKKEEILNDPVCCSQVNMVIHALQKNEEDRKAKAEEEANLKEAATKEKKIKIEKRKTTEASQAKKPPPWKVATALPEDYSVHLMKAVKESTIKTGADLTQPYSELTDLQQSVIRTCRLRHLCRSLSSIEGVEIDVINADRAVEIGNERFIGPEEDVVDPQMELEAVEAMRKARLMKDMAASRLRNEVQALEMSLGTKKSRDSALCLYLVPDTSALCFELPHIRRLVASERFFVVISKTVIDGLDSLKKELQGARDAIRYLEYEFKKTNRFIRAQSNDEVARGVPGERPKLRRQDIDAWRFYRIIECCRFLMQQEANKTNTGVKEHSGLVTILTHERASCSQFLTSAIASAKAYGIQTKSATSFSKSWAQNSS